MPKKIDIEEMQKIAKSRNGACLSEIYTNNNTKLCWRCKEGHEWTATPGNIKSEKWCPVCANHVPLTIGAMQKIAEARGGNCLSDKYKNARTNLHWRCKEGHEWEATPDNVKHGQWCPVCSGNTRLTIEEMQKIAKSRGGTCISTVYKNARTNLRWRCKEGHEWDAVPDRIKRESWCPVCADKVSERICRKLFEYIFDEKFPCKKPAWLRKLELDGYSETLGIAFEYNGAQHYKPVGLFHRNRTLDKQIESDKLKKRLCEEYGIKLIEIPYTVQHEDMFDYIVQICKQQGIQVPAKEKVDYRLLDAYSPHHLYKMQVLAESKGGVCVSKNYIDSQTKLRWRCKKGHDWEAMPNHIKNGTWCPVCSGKARLTIDEMQKIAESHGGTCISGKYNDCFTKLWWRCKKGHKWEATPDKIKRGSWCPICSGNIPLTIGEMREIAASRTGECLSETYTNNHTKLKWRCKEGHIWDAIPGSIRNGTWCPYCAKASRRA